ncbi:hypothetical protein [Silvimonas iriomotensis]|uniref:Fibronectin type-III domain-containing protein n=1 Tax=Silvimonas iriomotensis TaxID=449662 RepID=A0ABQ2PDR1_9NEIS|nr:hypothetical protein [Silvimonas iriomotensis]GGP23395.1 hypothetical protein GCM10010970_33950 [Silvimonas iriomotensis]
MNTLFNLLAIAGTCALLAACNSGDSSSSNQPAPTGFKVQPADGAAIITWNQELGVNYWMFGAQSSDLTVQNVLSQPGSLLVDGVTSPYVATGLTNGLVYSYLMNANTGSDKAGPATAALSVIPQASGYTWTNSAPMSAANIYGQTFNLGMYVAVGAGGAILTSSDGATWAPQSSGTSEDLYSATYTSSLADVYVAVGANGTVVTSQDGVTWKVQTSGTLTSSTLRAVAQNGAFYVAVGDNGTVMTSTNAYDWTVQTSPTSSNFYGITYDSTNSTFYAVGQGGLLMSSTNGWQWTLLNSGTSQDLYSIATGNSLWVAVGANGTILQSADASTWYPQTSNTTENLYSVVYGSQFVAVGGGGIALNGTTTGTAWTGSNPQTSSDLRSVSFFYYRLLALGTGGTNTLSY